MGTPVTLENITYATATSPKDQDSGNPSARAVMAAAGKPGREPGPGRAGLQSPLPHMLGGRGGPH